MAEFAKALAFGDDDFVAVAQGDVGRVLEAYGHKVVPLLFFQAGLWVIAQDGDVARVRLFAKADSADGLGKCGALSGLEVPGILLDRT